MRTNRILTAAFAASIAAMTSAHAGGFSRGSADTDILYEEGNFNMRAGATVVAPQRGYETIAGAPATDSNFSDAYIVPTAALKFNLTDDLRCAGTYTQPFGASVTYGPQAITAGIAADPAVPPNPPTGTAFTKFSTDEFGATCAYRFAAGKGNFWVLGGVFVENISYEEANRIGAAVGPLGVLRLQEDGALGYRLGAAYTIPDIALKVEGMYRSAVEHNLAGTFDVNSTPMLDNPFANGAATLPQSFELKVQSGIAPGWLAFGSVKWTDWSVFQRLTYFASVPGQFKEFRYQDGWTVTAGIGHAFTDNISGALSLTWDKGVATTEDAAFDTWTLAGGVSMTDSIGGQLRLGGAVSLLQGGAVGAEAGPGLPGAAFAYSVGTDFAFAASGSYSVKW